MKITKLAGVIGIALTGAMSGQAMALAPTATVNMEINISGASAQQKTIGAMLSSYCAAGTLDTYQDAPGGTAKKGKLWKSYFCQLKGVGSSDPDTADFIPAALEGQNVLFNNRSKGGSIWGVVPVNQKWMVEYLNINNGNCSVPDPVGAPNKWDCTTATRATGVDLAGTNECPYEAAAYGSATSDLGTVTVDADTKCRRSEGGVSDVEAAMFDYSINRPAFPAGAGADQLARQSAAFGVVFGLSVDHKVYTELQKRDGLINTIVADGEACDSDFASATCRPSMTKPEVTAVLNGKIKNWKSGFGLNGIAGGFGDMAVCRRVKGSGTQAAANAYWMEAPCRTGNLGGLKAMASATDTTSYKVIENSSSGGVIQCHNEMHDGTCATCGTYDYGSIGFNAIEKQPKATDKWAFIKIDGIDPTVENYLNGKYDYAYENTMQYHNDLAGNAKIAMDMIFDNAPSPTFLKSAGVSGVAALCGLGFTPAAETATEAPVTRATRGGNSCAAMSVCP